MNVSLTPHLEEYVKQKVKSGLYNSSSEVVREALRLLEERDKLKEIQLDELRKEIQKGIDSVERGEVVEFEGTSLSEFFKDIRTKGRERLDAERKKRG